MKKKIFESQIIDYDTGEVTSVTQVTVSKFNETFSLCRTTEGLEWIFELTGNEFKLLLFLLEIEDLKSKLVRFTKSDRDLFKRLAKVGDSWITKSLASLEEKEYLLRLNKNELVVNPKAFYKGASKEVLPRIQEFNRIFKSKKSGETGL